MLRYNFYKDYVYHSSRLVFVILKGSCLLKLTRQRWYVYWCFELEVYIRQLTLDCKASFPN